MVIKYEFNDGTVSEVEVSDEIGEFIVQSRRDDHALDERERYHRECSLDALHYEGPIFAEGVSLEDQYVREINREELGCALRELTPTQRKRLLRRACGKTYREIAEKEGVQAKAVHKSVVQAREIVQRFLKDKNYSKNF